MTSAALIVAAGMSSRMGDFKPMLNIGSISIAQRVVATFQQAGVGKIVMVTGYNATTLERHLAGNGIIFLRNDYPEYRYVGIEMCGHSEPFSRPALYRQGFHAPPHERRLHGARSRGTMLP